MCRVYGICAEKQTAPLIYTPCSLSYIEIISLGNPNSKCGIFKYMLLYILLRYFIKKKCPGLSLIKVVSCNLLFFSENIVF